MRKSSLAAALIAALVAVSPAFAADEWHHAMSLVAAPKYGPDFKHFDWVNPDAPKGGSVTMSDSSPYDSFNSLPPGSNPPTYIGVIYDTLMQSSVDEGSTAYGLVAESVSYPEDRSSVTYRLRKEARFHDGQPITPEDVIWSFEKARDVQPFYAQYYKNVDKVEKTGEHEVTFRFNVKGNRELPQIVSEFAIMPKHWWTANGADGKPRDISKAMTEFPLGSGPYRVKSADVGKYIVYERVADYWAKDLPNNKGMWNFDTIKVVSYSDPNVEFEAFKAGEVEFRRENSSKKWAQQYDFKGMLSKAAKKELYPLNIPEGLQGFIFNIRRPQFADKRVREALGLAFDFEWSNKNLFFDQYTRSASYFTNSDYASRGLPTGRELELLNEVKDKVPAEVFTTEFKNPVNATSDALRDHVRTALALLKDAGWEIKSGNLVNAKTGEPMKLEFLASDDTFDRIINPYFQNLKRLGVNATIRRVDGPQYIQRERAFDYDMLLHNYAQSESPGNEQRDFWGSAAADTEGATNYIGIKNPAVDQLIDRIVLAKDHDDLVQACRALDRVLLWNHYLVPNWHIPAARLAYWDKFRHPEHPPSRDPGFVQVWWYDKDAAPRIDAQKAK
jgi:microcin C transport system substrate-binding protein